MKDKKFIDKWNVAFENYEQRDEFAIEMQSDLNAIKKDAIRDFINYKKKYPEISFANGGKTMHIEDVFEKYKKEKL
jgi:dihydroneopterin aldolase